MKVAVVIAISSGVVEPRGSIFEARRCWPWLLCRLFNADLCDLGATAISGSLPHLTALTLLEYVQAFLFVALPCHPAVPARCHCHAVFVHRLERSGVGDSGMCALAEALARVPSMTRLG